MFWGVSEKGGRCKIRSTYENMPLRWWRKNEGYVQTICLFVSWVIIPRIIQKITDVRPRLHEISWTQKCWASHHGQKDLIKGPLWVFGVQVYIWKPSVFPLQQFSPKFESDNLLDNFRPYKLAKIMLMLQVKPILYIWMANPDVWFVDGIDSVFPIFCCLNFKPS